MAKTHNIQLKIILKFAEYSKIISKFAGDKQIFSKFAKTFEET
jgi:hypothetical protein